MRQSSRRGSRTTRRSAARLRLLRFEDRALPSFGFGSAFRFGNTGFDTGLGIAVDTAGSVYVSGYYSGTVDFDPNGTNPSSNHVLTNANDFEGYTAKYLADGTFQWATDLGTGGWAQIAVSGANVYLGYASWVGSTGGPYNLFAAQLNGADGTPVWTTPLATDSPDRYVDVAAGPSGTVYLTGINPSSQAFVAKLDSAGNVLWSRATSGSSSTGKGIAVDAAGNAFATGGYTGAVTFGTTARTSWSGTQDAFVWKLDGNGNSLSAVSVESNGDDFGYDIALDGSGNVVLTGQWGSNGSNASQNNDFDPGSKTARLTNNGNSDIFVEKLNGSLQLAWAKSIGGTLSDWGHSVAIDAAGNVYTTGSFTGPVDFNPGPQKYTLPGYGNRDIFVSKLDANGNFVAAAAMGGTAYDDGTAIALDDSGNAWSTGGFRGIDDFDPGIDDFDPGPGTYYLEQSGYNGGAGLQIYDAYVSKLTQSSPLLAAAGSVTGTKATHLTRITGAQNLCWLPMSRSRSDRNGRSEALHTEGSAATGPPVPGTPRLPNSGRPRGAARPPATASATAWQSGPPLAGSLPAGRPAAVASQGSARCAARMVASASARPTGY